MEEGQKIVWRAYEYEWKERSVDWFWTVGIIALLVLGFSIWLKATLFGVFMFLALTFIAYLSIRKPEELEITVDEKGVQIGENMMTYKVLQNFWITDSPEPKLILTTKRVFIPRITIPLVSVESNNVKQILIKFLKEEEMEESNSKKLLEKAGL